MLAEVYLEKDELGNAEKYCTEVVKGRKRIHGRNNPQFLESVELLIEIYQRKGDHVTAQGYKSTFLPTGPLSGTRTWQDATHLFANSGFKLEGMDRDSKIRALHWAIVK